MVMNPDPNVAERLFEEQPLLMAGLIYVLAVVSILLLLTEFVGMRSEFTLVFAILVPLIPFLIMMVNEERLKKLRVGRSGFEISFTEAIAQDVQPMSLENEILEIDPGGVEGIVPNYTGNDIAVEYRTVLKFQLGELHNSAIVDEFLADMPRLSYVVFADPLSQFKGLMAATDFRSIYSTDPGGFLDRITYERILDIEDVVTETISPESTNAQALETMADENVDMLGVVDDDGEFIGVVTQDAISRGILLALFHETKA